MGVEQISLVFEHFIYRAFRFRDKELFDADGIAVNRNSLFFSTLPAEAVRKPSIMNEPGSSNCSDFLESLKADLVLPSLVLISSPFFPHLSRCLETTLFSRSCLLYALPSARAKRHYDRKHQEIITLHFLYQSAAVSGKSFPSDQRGGVWVFPLNHLSEEFPAVCFRAQNQQNEKSGQGVGGSRLAMIWKSGCMKTSQSRSSTCLSSGESVSTDCKRFFTGGRQTARGSVGKASRGNLARWKPEGRGSLLLLEVLGKDFPTGEIGICRVVNSAGREVTYSDHGGGDQASASENHFLTRDARMGGASL